jgi:hypothetical protein
MGHPFRVEMSHPDDLKGRRYFPPEARGILIRSHPEKGFSDEN